MTEETAGTPRVDAVWSGLTEDSDPNTCVDFARQLEREVAALTTQRDEAHAKLDLAAEDAAGLEELLRSHQSGHSAATNALAKEMEENFALAAECSFQSERAEAAEAQRDELQKRIGYSAVPVAEGGAKTTASGTHTPEPWCMMDSTRPGGSCTIQISDSKVHNNEAAIVHWMGFDSGDRPTKEKRANARRIVACVNYCVGQDTKKIESDYAQGYSAFDHVAHLLATGTAQATECETNGTEGLRAELDAAKRALAEVERKLTAVVYAADFMRPVYEAAVDCIGSNQSIDRLLKAVAASKAPHTLATKSTECQPTWTECPACKNDFMNRPANCKLRSDHETAKSPLG